MLASQDYDDDGLPIVESKETPPEVESAFAPSYSMRGMWYMLAVIVVVGIYVIRRRGGQAREDKEFEA